MFIEIMIDSVIKANKKYYPQTLLKECKCVKYTQLGSYLRQFV